MKNDLVQYIYGIADNALILGQRLGELCGHGPSLETDIAMTNISLDLLGQTRSYFQYAAQLLGDNANEDTVAFLRSEREYKNVLLVEQPNTDFGYSIARQFLFDAFHLLLLEELQNSTDETLAAIAKKASKKCGITYVFHPIGSNVWATAPKKAIKEYSKRLMIYGPSPTSCSTKPMPTKPWFRKTSVSTPQN